MQTPQSNSKGVKGHNEKRDQLLVSKIDFNVQISLWI